MKTLFRRPEGGLCLDVKDDEARALHRIVRAMHDGHCPSCGHLAPAGQGIPAVLFIETYP